MFVAAFALCVTDAKKQSPTVALLKKGTPTDTPGVLGFNVNVGDLTKFMKSLNKRGLCSKPKFHTSTSRAGTRRPRRRLIEISRLQQLAKEVEEADSSPEEDPGRGEEGEAEDPEQNDDEDPEQNDDEDPEQNDDEEEDPDQNEDEDSPEQEFEDPEAESSSSSSSDSSSSGKYKGISVTAGLTSWSVETGGFFAHFFKWMTDTSHNNETMRHALDLDAKTEDAHRQIFVDCRAMFSKTIMDRLERKEITFEEAMEMMEDVNGVCHASPRQKGWWFFNWDNN